MAIEDWLPAGFDAYEDEQDSTCRYCDEPIWWEDFHGRWTAVDAEGERHQCPAMIANASDFPRLED